MLDLAQNCIKWEKAVIFWLCSNGLRKNMLQSYIPFQFRTEGRYSFKWIEEVVWWVSTSCWEFILTSSACLWNSCFQLVWDKAGDNRVNKQNWASGFLKFLWNTIHFISVPHEPNHLHNVCLDNQDGKRVRECLNDVHGTNNFCTWGNVACFSFLVIKSTHSSVILVSWFSFAVKSYFAGALEIIERRVVSYSSDHNSCIT